MTRLKALVSNPVERSPAGMAYPFYALEHIESGTGRVAPGAQIEDLVDDTAVMHQPGDVRFGKLRPYLSKSLYMTEPGHGSGELLVLRPRPNEMDGRFLRYVMLSKRFVEWATATSYGVKMPRTSWEAIGQFQLDAPALEVQRQIADYLDEETASIDAVVAEQERQIELLGLRNHLALRSRLTGRYRYDGPVHEVGPYWLGPVPESWSPHKVAWRFKTGSGTTPPTSRRELYDGEIPWVNTGELRETVIRSTVNMVTAQAVEELSALKVYPSGSIVVALYGATIGRVGVLGVEAAVNQACCVIHSPTAVMPEFIFFWLQAHRSEIADLGEGGGQPNIGQDTIRSLRVPAPDLATQADIVASVRSDLQAHEILVDELAAGISLLREHRQALITAAVTGGVDVLPEMV